MSDRPAVDAERLLGRLAALGEVGSTGDGGVSRLALTDADRDGRDLVLAWMHDLGLRVDVDGVGNVTATWPPDRFDPPVLMGSHIDTVATGGRYDGNLGVLAGLEVIEAVIVAGTVTRHPLAVALGKSSDQFVERWISRDGAESLYIFVSTQTRSLLTQPRRVFTRGSVSGLVDQVRSNEVVNIRIRLGLNALEKVSAPSLKLVHPAVNLVAIATHLCHVECRVPPVVNQRSE